jgi:Family of unknown function (DUF5670)
MNKAKEIAMKIRPRGNPAHACPRPSLPVQYAGNKGDWAVRVRRGGDGMLWTIFVILLVLWLLGLVTSYTLGGFIHLLLVIALVVLLIQLISGRRPVL